MKETNAELTTELARYKNQEKCFEISQENSAKQITTLNEEIANLNNQLSKENATISFLQEERKRLKIDFKTREDELFDKQILLENRIKELDNILVKTGQSIQTMHMLTPKSDSFYHPKSLKPYVQPLNKSHCCQLNPDLGISNQLGSVDGLSFDATSPIEHNSVESQFSYEITAGVSHDAVLYRDLLS
ncbi:hypothetical protein Tco_1324423 [Tanacetum coccineum]